MGFRPASSIPPRPRTTTQLRPYILTSLTSTQGKEGPSPSALPLLVIISKSGELTYLYYLLSSPGSAEKRERERQRVSRKKHLIAVCWYLSHRLILRLLLLPLPLPLPLDPSGTTESLIVSLDTSQCDHSLLN